MWEAWAFYKKQRVLQVSIGLAGELPGEYPRAWIRVTGSYEMSCGKRIQGQVELPEDPSSSPGCSAPARRGLHPFLGLLEANASVRVRGQERLKVGSGDWGREQKEETGHGEDEKMTQI